MAVCIEPDRCGECGNCVDACPSDALLETATGILHLGEICSDCGLCLEVCPCGAIDRVPADEEPR